VIGLDTNVVIRYLTQDDPAQSAAATRLIESLDEHDPGFLSIAAAVEVGWVLSRSYGVGRETLAEAFDRLLSAQEIIIQHSDSVRIAVDVLREGGDFADAVIADLGRRAGCRHTVTFDRRAARLIGMTPIKADGN
jgi:predicted nucleic-acid-binding protein